MSQGYKAIFTAVGILILITAVWLAVKNESEGHGHIEILGFKITITGPGVAMAIIGLAAMTIPWLLPELDVLDASDHPPSHYQICAAPSGSWIVVDDLPDGPLNVRIGADISYQEINALRSGTDGLNFDECVIKHSGTTPWWRIGGGGWLFSRYVELQ